MSNITQTLTQIFTLFDQCQEIYNENIAKEHNAHMVALFNTRAEDVSPYFQQRLKTASDQRDAYSHLSSVIGVKKIIMASNAGQAPEDLQALFSLASDAQGLTGMAVTLQRTQALLGELNTGLDDSQIYSAQEIHIAKRVAAGCEILIEKVKEMQGLCISLQ